MRSMRVKRTIALVIVLILLVSSSAAAQGGGLNGWAYEAVGFFEAAETLAEVKVALIDTGVRTKRLGSERIEAGKNYVFAGADTDDLVGHGTRIASLILGCTNGKGNMPPLSANARIVPLVYYSRYASGVTKSGGVEAICAAIYDAVDLYGCRVINVSVGFALKDDRLEAAIQYAEDKGVIVVAAAGNDNIRAPERLYYPAAYDTVVSVGAANEKMEPAAFSQRNNVTVYAPGDALSVVSIRNGRVFETVSGTSYAAAFATALAANLLGKHPDMSPAEFRFLLGSCAAGDDSGGWRIIDYGLLRTRK